MKKILLSLAVVSTAILSVFSCTYNEKIEKIKSYSLKNINLLDKFVLNKIIYDEPFSNEFKYFNNFDSYNSFFATSKEKEKQSSKVDKDFFKTKDLIYIKEIVRNGYEWKGFIPSKINSLEFKESENTLIANKKPYESITGIGLQTHDIKNESYITFWIIAIDKMKENNSINDNTVFKKNFE
ncbi:hypothetical protein [Mesomycoplasma neurolyticum]|uniref:Lipoprotein n=1 Tax=Mesomycoplasma neurolyticum TaxID=2120 RepID=A0A449A5P2_9BACT|nr:hypothetical protein [Mesomycoplasma neurolyticum]VEU59544.1 Uncharacterised protein [Mesomycoplasma neurolyticum]